jgi:hypothetical protein
MRNFVVKFIPKDAQSQRVIHKIAMPEYGDKGFYRTIESWNGFMTGRRKDATKEEKQKHLDGCTRAPTGLYYVHDHTEEEWLAHNSRTMESIARITKKDISEVDDETKLPVVNHKSLYDFYDYIGFDRKTRKYRHENI